MNPASLWNWIFKRSPQNAANPNPLPTQNNFGGGFPTGGSSPIEISTEEEVVWGINLPFGEQDSVGRGPLDELIRARRNFSAIGACAHVMLINNKDKPQEHIRTVAGQCYFCKEQLRKLKSKGLISELDAERLSLVCNECAKITASGKLCCPNHYAAVKDESGNEIYLDPEDQEQQKWDETMQNILSPLLSLITYQEQKDE